MCKSGVTKLVLDWAALAPTLINRTQLPQWWAISYIHIFPRVSKLKLVESKSCEFFLAAIHCFQFISEDAGMPSLRRIHTHHMQLRAVRRVVHHGGVVSYIMCRRTSWRMKVITIPNPRIVQLHIPVGVQLHDVDGINLREVYIPKCGYKCN